MQLITINTHTYSVRLFWTMVRTIAETSTWLHTTHSMDRHPCPWQVRTCNPNERVATAPRLIPHGHWDQHEFFLLRRKWYLVL